MFDSSSPGTPKISPELIRAHAEIIHRLAAPLAGKGKLVIAAFGEDPDRPNPKTGAPGYPLPPLIRHVGIGDVEKTVSVICDLSSRRHYNVYMPLAVFRLDLPAGRKGTEEDVVAVLGNVADFDDPDAARWSERLPLPASCALETSAGRFQAFTFFDQPEAFVTVKPVAGRLKAFSRCDNGTIDTCHVWRIPGTLNWPNAKKVGEGRPREPQTVRVVKPWRGDRTSLIDLAAALPEPSEPETGERGDEEAEADQGANTDTNGAGSDDVSIALVLKVLSAKLRARITEPAPTGNRSDRLYHVIRALIDLQFDNSLIKRIIRAHPNGIGVKYARRSDLDLVKEIARIRSKASKSAAAAADPLSELIGEFNSQYAVVNEAGQAMVYEQLIDPIRGRTVLVRIKFPDFKKFYQNRRLTVAKAGSGSVTRTAADWWLNHEQRRQYLGGVVFDPTGNAPADCWNLWSGFAVEPQPGDWSLMRDHIRKVICSGDDALTEYLLNWIARMFQQPNKPGEVAVVLRGAKGAGKGIVCVWLIRAWGQHGLHITNAKHLVGNFNAHLRDCVALFVDEAFFAGDRQHESVLKGIITESTLPIEGKYQNVVEVLNMLHVMMASNSDWVVPASHDERRFAVFDVADNRVGDRRYFADIAAQMENGGLGAMIYDMLHRDISGFEVRDVPETGALADQKKHSLDSLDRWWLNVLERGFVWRSRHGAADFAGWGEFYTTELLNQSYLQWCGDNRVHYPQSRTQLGSRMRELYQWSRPRGMNIIGEVVVVSPDGDAVMTAEHQPGYLVGALDLARVRFSEVRKVTGEWGNQP